MALGGHSPTSATQAGTSIVGFLGGVAVAFALSRRVHGTRRAPAILALELVPLVVVVVIAGARHGDAVASGLHAWFAVALASFAMGAQTEVIRRVAGVAITTTYQSGAVARAGEAVASTGPRTPRRDRAWAALAVVAVVLISYATGAALGATAESSGRWALAVPACIVALVLVAGLTWGPAQRALLSSDA
jgi:uncharacterized membrane protein YoaK (UPF0700 family)